MRTNTQKHLLVNNGIFEKKFRSKILNGDCPPNSLLHFKQLSFLERLNLSHILSVNIK